MIQIKAVVFDLGKVLLQYDPNRLFSKLIPDPERREHFLTHICNQEWNERQDAGRSIIAATQARVREFPEWEAEIRAFYDRWIEMVPGDIGSTVQILAELKARDQVRLFACTNFAAETLEIVKAKYDWFAHFEDMIVSAYEGVNKPDPAIYAAAERAIGLPPETLLFTDDRQDNIDAALARGWQGHLFEGAAGLRTTLERDRLL